MKNTFKKIKRTLAAFSVAAIALTGCSAAENTTVQSDSSDASDVTVIKVGATSTPHAEILDHIKDTLAEQGYELQITVYDDYVLPNRAVSDGELDANYFQHTPYLNSYNEANGTDIVSAASIHYEPFGLYANGISDIASIPDGATIIIPADDSNETRALLLLAQEGLITLPDGANAADGVKTLDIVDDHGFNITTVQADTVAAQFNNGGDGTLAVINGNYALAAGLKISDALASEDSSGDAAKTYANIVAVNRGNENSEKIKALISALETDDVRAFIDETYGGAVSAIF